MKIHRLAPFALATAFLVMLSAASASTVYLAPQVNNNLYANNQIGFTGNPGVNGGGAYGVGNTITLAGSASSYGLGTVDLFGYAGGGSLPIEIDLYSGANPNTGSLLGSEQVIPQGNGWTTEVFNFNIPVPQTLTYIVSIVGNSGSYDDSFVDWQQFTGNTGSPATGTSGDMWYGAPGNYAVDNSFAIDTGAETNTLAAEFNANSTYSPSTANTNATPEPSSLFLLGTGLIGLAFVAYRKAKSSGAFQIR
jgi:hypothetical protein